MVKKSLFNRINNQYSLSTVSLFCLFQFILAQVIFVLTNVSRCNSFFLDGMCLVKSKATLKQSNVIRRNPLYLATA